MKNISKKMIIACCSFLCASACVAGYVGAKASADNKYAYTNTLLKSSNVMIKDGYEKGDKKGLLLSSSVNGGTASYKDTVSGKFTTEFDFVGSNTEATFRFKDRENYTQFAIKVVQEGGYVSAYIEYDGAKGGIYYQDGLAIGQTEEKNANNLYTRVAAGDSVSLSFDPATMTVRLGEYLVWDLSAEKNDGYSIAQGIRGFAYYSVAVHLNKAENNGGIVLYELLGESLEYIYLRNDLAAPSIYADFGLNGIKGQSFALPKPYVYDLQDGSIDKNSVKVKITDENKQTVFNGAWEENSSFIPQTSGEYLAVYTVTDEAGNAGEQRFIFRVLAETPKEKFQLGHTVSKMTYGVGSVVELPTATVYYDLFNMDSAQYAEYYMTINGTPITNICGRKANKSYKVQLTVQGIYELHYRYTVGNVELRSETVCLTATDELPACSDIALSNTMYVGAEINVPPATLSLKGETKDATAKLVAPSGEEKGVAKNEKIVLDKAGMYTLVYSAEFNGVTYEEKKEIIVSYSPNSLFKDTEGIDAKLGYFPYDSSINGMVVNIKDSERAEFAQAIDFGSYDSQKPFIELLSVSKSSSMHNVREYLITLTDVNDYNNHILIRINAATSVEKSWVSCAAKGGTPFGWNGTKYELGKRVTEGGTASAQAGGTPINHSFRSINNYGFENQTIKLYYDNEQRQIFVDSDGVRTMVADLDEYSFVNASGASFNGFSENKAYVSVAYTDFAHREWHWSDMGYYVGSHDVMVLQYAGYDFRLGTTVDAMPPEIFIDVKSDVPLAVVGREFNVFKATALDGIDGNVDVTYSVYRGNDRNEPLPMNGSAFTPTEVGAYTIVYRAMDYTKNATEKTVSLEAVTDVPAFKVNLQEGTQSTVANIGDTVSLRIPQTSGGVGYGKVDVKVTLNGEEIAVNDNCIEIESVGAYKVTYVGKDYIGNADTVFYNIQAESLNEPLFNVLPAVSTVIEKGQSYVLPVVSATDYSDASDVKAAQIQVYVSENGGEYTACGATYTPSAGLTHGAKLTFKYVATGAKGSTEKYTGAYYSDIDKKNGSIDMENYFVADGVSTTLSNMGITANFVNNGMLVWGKRLTADGFRANVNFSGISDVKLVLSDMYNGKERLEVSVKKLGAGNYTVAVDGSEASANLDDTVEVSYNAKKKTLTVGSVSVNAASFEGFSSGFVHFAFVGNSGNSVVVSKLFNQNINTITLDNSTPNISLSADLTLRVTQGSEYTLPTALASDVLGDLTSNVTVTVEKEDGIAAKDINGKEIKDADATIAYTLKLTETGKYRVRYTVKDSNGKAATYSSILTVAPFGAAAIDIEVSAPKAKASVGEKIILERAMVESGVTVFISVIYQTGGGVEIDKESNSFIANRAGTYTVKYTAYDARGNYAVKSFEIKVG